MVYAYTESMLPNHKESAMFHLPTYGLGIIFHIGIFISLFLFLLSFFPVFCHWIAHYQIFNIILITFILLSVLSGILLFAKRIIVKDLRVLSTPDDYISNGLTVLFQCFTALFLYDNRNEYIVDCYYFASSLFYLYIPLGKLRHVVYFFAARYHLGFFYGWRGSWPPEKLKKIKNK